MSTEIKSIATPRTVTIKEFHGTGAVVIESNDPIKGLRTINVNRVEFLAAVETELGVRLVAADAIVIDRAMIPKVLDDGPYPSARSVSGARSFILNPNDTHESLTCDIAALVALRNYRTAHPAVPPVSDEDVETLAGLLLAEGLRSVGFATVARRLLATGKVEVTP